MNNSVKRFSTYVVTTVHNELAAIKYISLVVPDQEL